MPDGSKETWMIEPIFIFSDLHLSNPRCDTEGIRRVLQIVNATDGKIILAGNTVDLYYAARGKFDIECQEILIQISSLLMLSVSGNHDTPRTMIPMFDSDREYYPSVTMEIDERLWYIEHGHLFGNLGWLFRLIDKWEDNILLRKVGRWLLKSNFLCTSGGVDRDKFRDTAIDMCKLKGATIVIAGYSHSREIYRDSTGQHDVVYANPGSAIDKFTYIVYQDGKFTMEDA